MPGSSYSEAGAAGAGGGAGALMGAIVSAGLACVVGAVAGLVLARAMRALRVHWSWAALALGLLFS